MNKSPLLAATVLAAALGALSFGAQAAEPQGWYAGAGVGQSMVDEVFADDEDTAFQGFGGYQFTPYFGLEAAYTDFGDIDGRAGIGRYKADTVSLTAVGTLPITDSFSAYAKAGVHDWDAELGAPGVGRVKDSGTDPTYGLGLQYRFTDAFALRGEYSRFEMDDVDVEIGRAHV